MKGKMVEYGITSFGDGAFKSQQSGVLRTNCLDCLDRTNAVQMMFAMKAIELQAAEMGIDASQVGKFKGLLQEKSQIIRNSSLSGRHYRYDSVWLIFFEKFEVWLFFSNFLKNN